MSGSGYGSGAAADENALTPDVLGRVRKQKDFFATGGSRPVPWRCEQIKKLVMCVVEAADQISAAQASDGVTPSAFAPGSTGMLMGVMGYYLAMVEQWSKPKDLVDTLPAERRMGIECDWLRVQEPKGVVLNIAPWNAPILLSILPCLGALAAGNCCVIKPPEAAPATSKLLSALVSLKLSPDAVTVVEGGASEVGALIDLGFDHIMFTGGTSIGKVIMARAAQTLTPVTLELGGKNPVFIDEMDEGLMDAAVKEIVGTKMYFAGEFCQCHDIILIHDTMWDKFMGAMKAGIEALGEKRMVRMIHAKHYERLKNMLTSHNGTNAPEPPACDDSGLRLPITAVVEPQDSDPIMQDEVFGPFWPVLRVASVEEAIKRVNSIVTGKPLVSYYYGKSEANMNSWIERTSSGSLAINAGPMRMQGNFNAAIHGVGNSGLGGASIWGEHVFNTFSHAKHIVKPKQGAFAGSVWGAGPYIPKL